MVIAETPRLSLRHLRHDDAVAMNAVFGDPEVMLFGDGVRDPEWVTFWIAKWLNEYYPRWQFGAWAVVDKGSTTVIGYCGLSRFPERCSDVEAELGFRLARPYWGRGLATEAATAVRDHAFAVLGVPRLIAHIDPANVGSLHVVAKLGMRYARDVMLPGYDHPDHVYAIDRTERT